MFFSCAENNGFLHTACGLEVVCNLLRNLCGSVLENNVVVKVAVGVYAILNYFSCFIALSLIRTPAFADICFYIDNIKGRKETVINAFTQTVSIYRLTEVVYV